MLKGHMLTGEILSTDAGLQELFDLTVNTSSQQVAYMRPVDTDDPWRTAWYDEDMDEFVDYMGYPIFRESWVQDHDEWVICVLD